MKFMHIAPTEFIPSIRGNPQLLLAHLIDENHAYRDAVDRTGGAWEERDRMRIMDNSAFEMYQRDLPMFSAEKLIELGIHCGAGILVLPDYPGEDGRKTIDAAKQWASKFKENRFDTFFAPQSEVGDLEGYIETFTWAAVSPLIDVIGVSCIGVPNAFGVYNNQIQQFNARAEMFKILERRGILDLVERNGKRLHILGMLDGPKEILLLAPWIKSGLIQTWDSSAAYWAGINGVRFDNSPTGLINGKIKSHVDFDWIPSGEDDLDLIKKDIRHNSGYIYGLINEAKR